MKYRMLIFGTFVATLGASFMHQASAQWSTGGSTTISRKSSLDGLNLFCDLNTKSFRGDAIAPANQLKIVTSPSQSNQTGALSLTFEGEMFCAELEPNAPRSLNNAAVRNGVELVGRFKLDQQDPKLIPQRGLAFSQVLNIRTWIFEVPLNPAYPFPELLYHLVPANAATANKFCQNGVTDCKVLIGLQLPANPADYPARDIDGDNANDLTEGQVLSFSTITSNGIEVPRNFYWGPCHSGTFGTPKTVVVNAASNFSHGGAGSSVTGFSFTQNQRIAVTVNQNDLWNSGGTLGWSNADGLTGQITSVAGDDSGTTPNTPIGNAQTLAEDSQRKLWKFIESSGLWESAQNAPVGTLVGTVNNDNRNFYIFGTAFDGTAPSFSGPKGGTLKLYSWDATGTDNTGSVTVTVATESIQCKVDDLAALTASGDVRGLRPVHSEGVPRINVAAGTEGGGVPFVVLGCNKPGEEITFADDGSPISLNPLRVLVNGQFVAIESFQVTDTVRNKDCDIDGTERDLNLKLHKQQFIQAIAPGGVCQNGSLAYRVELGNALGGWFIGRDTVDVNNCIQP